MSHHRGLCHLLWHRVLLPREHGVCWTVSWRQLLLLWLLGRLLLLRCCHPVLWWHSSRLVRLLMWLVV